MSWRVKLAAALALGTVAATGVRAETALSRDYLIGHWGIGEPEECNGRDTMSFYDSGAWAVTNGGGNPVEAIGLWRLEDGKVLILASDLRSTGGARELGAEISEVGADSFTMTAKPLQNSQATLYRCGF